MKNKSINLSAEEVISLITEQPVKKEGFCISSNSSFLAIMSLLSEKIAERLKDANTISA